MYWKIDNLNLNRNKRNIETKQIENVKLNIKKLEVKEPSGPSGLLNFILQAHRALRPCDPRNSDQDHHPG